MSLEELFKKLKDPRRKQGQRINKVQMFSLIVLSNLCGYFGGRKVKKFGDAYSKILIKELKLKHGIPSHVTISGFINSVDEEEFLHYFNEWAGIYAAPKVGEPVSGDGKALGSTVSNYGSKQQKFQAIVSLFCQTSGLVLAMKQYQNAKESEINIVRFLIEHLEQKGLTFFADSIHCQKKLLN